MAEPFDVALMREMMARQAADADRIVMLCDAVKGQAEEIAKLRAQVKTLQVEPALPSNPPA